MNRLKQLKTYPLGLFLWMEWLLLGVALFGESFSIISYHRIAQKPSLFIILPLISLIGLGVVGIKFPKDTLSHKWLYTFCQLWLLWLTFFWRHTFDTAHLIIIIRICLIFEKNQRLLAVASTVTVHWVSFILNYQNFQEYLQEDDALNLEQFKVFRVIDITSFLFGTCLSSAIIFILINALLREYKSRQELAIAHQKLHKYAILIEDRAIVNERNRAAREIYDSVGRALTAQAIQLNNAITFQQSESAKAHWFLLEAQKLVKITLRDLRYSVATLRADPLQGKSLKAALTLRIHDFSTRTQIPVQYSSVLTRSLSKEIEITVYRIVQEALTNIAKHSEATKAIVDLQTLPDYLQLTIEDNGKGFKPEQNTIGFGLQGLRERVAVLKGIVEISSQPGSGCAILIKLSYPTTLP